MAMRIVDLLDVVHVDEQEADARSLPCIGERRVEAALEQRPVWQAREEVMVGGPPDFLFGGLAVVDIGNAANPLPNRAVRRLEWHGVGKHPPVLPIGAPHPELDLVECCGSACLLPDGRGFSPIVGMDDIEPPATNVLAFRLAAILRPAPAPRNTSFRIGKPDDGGTGLEIPDRKSVV